MIQPQNILDTRILSNTSLDAEYSRQDNKHYINLIFSGRSLIELGVLHLTLQLRFSQNIHILFKLY